LEENKQSRVLNTESVPDEQALIVAARQGDKRAFGRLVRLFQRRVVRLVLSMTGDMDAAMDIVQDSFVRAYKALDRFQEGQPFYPWISTIATNLTLNYLKRSRREKSLDQEDRERPARGTDPLQKIQMAENDRRFLAAVEELPEQYRTVFVLRTFDDLSYEDIAKRLDISVGTVDSRLFRARRQLLEKLKDLLE
jgi:RNA polymerase sigma-70 factor (ECF subfamily)